MNQKSYKEIKKGKKKDKNMTFFLAFPKWLLFLFYFYL